LEGSTPLLNADRVTSGYGDMTIIREVSVSVESGEIVSIIGPNGAGKSTLMKTIFGLLKPTAGQVTFGGQDITGLAPERIVQEGISYVPQVQNVFPSLTVEENLEMGGFLRKGDLRPAKERVFTLFPRLAERRQQRVGKMSGGERQMVAMGRALMQDPRLLLLDEPSAGLAPRLVDAIFEQVVEVNRSGVAVLMVEQNAKKSLRLANRGYVLAAGENRKVGSGVELLQDPEVARLYLGG